MLNNFLLLLYKKQLNNIYNLEPDFTIVAVSSTKLSNGAEGKVTNKIT